MALNGSAVYFCGVIQTMKRRMQTRSARKTAVLKACFILCIALCATPYVSAPIALVGGFLFSLFWGHPFAKLNHKATGLLLKVSVVGLGFGMNVHSALQVGREGLELTVVSIALLLTLGYFVGRWLRMPRKSSHLVASGTAICGGSAIAAVAPAVDASEMLKQSQIDLCGRVDFTREVPLLGRDEAFSFACAGCGNCCRGREDIVLSGFDLWRIAVRLRLPMRTVARAFCKASIGPGC